MQNDIWKVDSTFYSMLHFRQSGLPLQKSNGEMEKKKKIYLRPSSLVLYHPPFSSATFPHLIISLSALRGNP